MAVPPETNRIKRRHPWLSALFLVAMAFIGLGAAVMASLPRPPALRVRPPILVLSSDDWGGNDPEETVTDLHQLAGVLREFCDIYGHRPVITAYMNPAAIDFRRVRETGYRLYAWKFCYVEKPDLLQAWRELSAEGLFELQFHGREHWNVPLWLKALNDDLPGFREACERDRIPYHGDIAYQRQRERDPRFKFLAASYVDPSVFPTRGLPLETQREMIREGIELIERYFGLRPSVLVPPRYVWDVNTWRAMEANGIRYIETVPQQIVEVRPDLSLSPGRKFVSWGKNPRRIRAILRSASYEPNLQPPGRGSSYERNALRAADETAAQVRVCLAQSLPAVISSHKGRYTGPNEERKRANLLGLRRLLSTLLHDFPDIAFLSASDCGHYVYGGQEATPRRKIPFEKVAPSFVERMQEVAVSLWSSWVGFTSWGVLFLLALGWTLLVRTSPDAKRKIGA